MVIASQSPAPRGRGRRGAISIALLVFYGIVLVILLAVAQQLSWRFHARVELQNADDAAAHAACCTLVNETVFSLPYVSGTSMVDDRAVLIQHAFTVGQQFAGLNRVVGKPLVLASNPQNLTDGELYVGTLDAPLSRTFINLNNPYYDPYNPDLNAVRVVTRRDRAGASATYYADRDVFGFRVQPTLATPPPFPIIPMVPIAILSDPCAPSGNTLACWASKGPSTWEQQIMARGGSDLWSIDPNTGQPTNTGDGIPEITLTLTENSTSGNAQPVYFDDSQVGTVDTLLAQIQNGVSYGDLPANNGQLAGQFLLDSVPPPPATNVATPATSALAAGQAGLLANGDPAQQPPTTGLQGILGQPRIWMLYSGVPSPGNNPTLNVVGFVAARIVSITQDGGTVQIVLQPSALITETAVTKRHRRDLGPRSLYNPYIARVRIVE